MTTLREAAQQALEALENTTPTGFNMERDKQFFAAITALRAALAQEEQEPVAVAETTVCDIHLPTGVQIYSGKRNMT
jgi:hypothetical protein